MWGIVARLLVVSRPRFWLYLAGPVLVGVAYGAPDVAALTAPLAVALFGYFLVPANVFLYGINDIYDADIDVENPKKAGRERRFRGDSVTVAAVLASAALGGALLVVSPPVARPYLLGFLVLGWAYSAPPLRLKTTPPLDSIVNGLYILPGAAAYAVVAGTHPPGLAVLGGWVWAMGMHTFSAIPDIDPDRRAGIDTTATVLGGPMTLAYCALAWSVAAAVFGVLDWRAGVLLAVYPGLVGVVGWRSIPVDDAYWWFPAINTIVGAAITIPGLWWVVHG
ncbi:MAG: prenyltransferase [Halobacteriaceae archaeon]